MYCMTCKKIKIYIFVKILPVLTLIPANIFCPENVICFLLLLHTVKPVLSGHSKIDKTNLLKANGSLMKVKSIAECFLRVFCNTFGLH